MEYVDLGLPSGKKWAKCNLGATSEEQAGLYYQWGDTVGYSKDQIGTDKVFYWSNYKFAVDGTSNKFSKYNETDGKTLLDLEDDPVYAALGENWRTPTKQDYLELGENCYMSYETVNGIDGCLVTGKNENSIFFPFVGFANVDEIKSFGIASIYLTSSLCNKSNMYQAYACSTMGGSFSSGCSTYSRYIGFQVRGIYVG